ncbi:MAG: protease inhibitor I42 family protein [Opitutales bacterium]|nr:protease inhibitor I42 family protein [Opitutales bacterium]
MQPLKLLIFSLVMTLLAACGGNPDEFAITAGYNGMSITKELKEPIMLKLGGNPKTGAQWKVISYDHDVIHFMDENPRVMNRIAVGPLANVMYSEWMIEGRQRGSSELYMEYATEDGEVLDSFRLTIVFE